ncbi:sulfatase [Salinibacter sp. 10B]|nr:sulfatase [Salinibacter sp. 10B]PQJ36583.1 sulfatase [Salinibacter sp. 10B]
MDYRPSGGLFWLFVFVLLIGSPTRRCAGQGTAPDRPNVLFILADDLGYMDVGAYNPDTFYETPNLDSLAQAGLMFTDGYAANPVCSPTRHSIMTGRHPSRDNHTDWFCGGRTERYRHAPYDCSMDTSQVTIGAAFQRGGYDTYFAGKWHLGPEPRHWPENQGFDVNKGGWRAGSPSAHGGGGYFSPYGNPRLEDGPEGEYLPYRLAEETEAFIEQERENPFFAFLSFYEVHNPKQAPDSLVEKYRRKRERMGLDEVDEFEGIEQVWPDEQTRRARVVQGHPVYAAMVEAMDRAVGRVLQGLRENGLADETIVVFTSDNGGLSTSEGHNTSNRPLRGGKGWLYEGGIREPYVIHWPGVTTAGRKSDVPVMSTDFYPTLLDAAGLPLRPDQHMDGVSLVPVLKGRPTLDRDALFWHYPHYSNQGGFPGGAVRMGEWKLIEDYEDGKVRLFNLEADLGERNNVAGQYPGRVEQMRQRLHAWYEEVGAHFLRAREHGPEPWRP